jgi:RNA polymerase sigma factor (sigma-70 family)
VLHTDEKLLSAYRAGETAAYEAVYRHYAEPVRRFLTGGFTFISQGRTCRFRGGSVAGLDLEAVMQETFARAFAPATRANYDGERPFKNYLFSIAKNLVLREFQRRDRVLHEEHTEEATDALALRGIELGFVPQGKSPERAVADSELSKVTQAFIKSLTAEQTAFFASRFARGLTQEATAKAMSCTRARVKLLEKNIRRRFLERLREHGYFVGYTPKARWTRQEAA